MKINPFLFYCLSEYPTLKLKLKSKTQIKQHNYRLQKKTENLLSTLLLENKLKKSIFDSIRKLYNNNSYRGIRHKRGLPVRGQRTHTNACTQKKLSKHRLNFSKKNESSVTL